MATATQRNGAAPVADDNAAAIAAKLIADADAAQATQADEALALEVAAAVKLAQTLTATPAVRPPTYNVADGAPSAPFGKQRITVGASAKSGDASYVLVNGTSQVGFPQAAIAVAIVSGIIPRATIKALWMAADAAAAK